MDQSLTLICLEWHVRLSCLIIVHHLIATIEYCTIFYGAIMHHRIYIRYRFSDHKNLLQCLFYTMKWSCLIIIYCLIATIKYCTVFYSANNFSTHPKSFSIYGLHHKILCSTRWMAGIKNRQSLTPTCHKWHIRLSYLIVI